TVGTLAGVRLGHPIGGILGGAGVSALMLWTSWFFGHPDPAGLACIPAGLFAGSLLWTGIPTRWLVLARAGTAALFVGVFGIVWQFQPELGTYGRPFGDPVDNRTGSRGGETKGGMASGFHPLPGSLRALSTDGRRLMIERQGAIQLWDALAGRQRDTFEPHP